MPAFVGPLHSYFHHINIMATYPVPCSQPYYDLFYYVSTIAFGMILGQYQKMYEDDSNFSFVFLL